MLLETRNGSGTRNEEVLPTRNEQRNENGTTHEEKTKAGRLSSPDQVHELQW